MDFSFIEKCYIALMLYHNIAGADSDIIKDKSNLITYSYNLYRFVWIVFTDAIF